MKEQEIQESTRHPGVSPTPIEEEALKANQKADIEVEAVSVVVTIQNDRRRPIRNHHGKDAF